MGISRVKDEYKEKLKEELKKEREEKEKLKKLLVKEKKKVIIRLADADLDGNKRLRWALLGIKGISFAMSKAICVAGGFDPNVRLKELSEEDLKKLEDIIRNPGKYGIPPFLFNRRRDPETGENIHLTGEDVKIRMNLDIQREIELGTYRGWRHKLGLPVRGQKTRSHFRKGRTVGVVRKKAQKGGK